MNNVKKFGWKYFKILDEIYKQFSPKGNRLERSIKELSKEKNYEQR